MRVTITGGTGFIGRALARRLIEAGHAVSVTARQRPTDLDGSIAFAPWDVLSGDPPLEVIRDVDAVVHLAGEPVAQRWTAATKARIRASRVEGTRRLVSALSGLERCPAVLVAASAIGIYGDRGDAWLTEASPPGRGFLAEVAGAWERESAEAEALGVRVVRLRIGIVLGREGGALARMLPLFRMGLGGQLGSGRQWMSWIHLDDLVGLIVWALGVGALRGPVNAVAPEPVTNREFTRRLAAALGRPAWFRVPALALRLLYGEMGSVLLESQRVYPEAALRAGFTFRHAELSGALRDLLSGAAATAARL